MVNRSLKIVSRGSQLALVQVDETLALLRPLLPDARFESTVLHTPGDRDLATPLSDTDVPEDFFTRDLDQALLTNQADISIHSAKDLPASMPAGLTVAALLPAHDIRDAMVFRADAAEDFSPRTIGTSSPRREETMRALFPEAQLLPLRGTIQDRMTALDNGQYEAIVVAACALDRLGLADRISQYLAYDPTPQQGRLAVVVRAVDHDLLEAMRPLDVRRSAGLVAFVGCPTDPSLLSDRARTYLNNADVIIHDRLLPDAVLLDIQEKAIPVGKAGGERSVSQSEIHHMLLREAEAGKLVVRLQGGDPGVFGHLAEELAFLRDWNLRADLVPTVTAAQVAAARMHAPLTHRGGGRGVALLSGRDTPAPFPDPAQGTMAIYMGSQRLSELASELAAIGWAADTPVVISERMGYRDETHHHTTLGSMASLSVEQPAVLLVGIPAFQPEGVTLFVGTDPAHFLKHGPLMHWPLIRLVARPIEERVAAIEEVLRDVAGVILPGRFAVRTFVETLMAIGDARLLHGKKLLAVGPATADELAGFGLRTDLAAASLGGVRDLVQTLTEEYRGKYLYPCSDAAPQKERAGFLAPYGVDLVPRVFYMNRAMPFRELPRTPFSRVLFTSSSTVKIYFENYADELKANRTWVAVGPSTLKTLEQLGLKAEMLSS